jgi:hypothetical protein
LVVNDPWLIAIAVLVGIAFALYLAAIFAGGRKMDMNDVVQLCLECAGMVAAVKMMVLAFRLGAVVKSNPVQEIFDAGSILIGGFVFLCATSYGVVHVLAEARTRRGGPVDGSAPPHSG